MNIFEQASIQKLRFASERGELTTEQLWDLPLTAKSNFDLNNVAKAVSRDLKNASEEDFVSAKTDAGAKDSLKLDIVKHIIAAKLAAQEALRNRAAKAVIRQKVLDALAHKQDAELAGLSQEELMKKLAELDD
jgi:hypothetical protein